MKERRKKKRRWGRKLSKGGHKEMKREGRKGGSSNGMKE